ncbi:MAG: YfhO family protein [Chthoniobacterales bacterium]
MAGACLFAPGIFVFWPFIYGSALLLYTDIGSDSLNSYYSDFVHLSHYIRSDGFPSWSFHIGMGQDLAYAIGYLIWEPVSWLPARFIANALVYQHLAKVVVAGLIFFRFLRLRSLPTGVALLGALLLGYSGYMCIGSCCALFVQELLAFSLILLGIELALLKGRWLLLTVSLALVGTVNPFYLYLAAVFLVIYWLASVFARHDWQPKKILIGSAVLGGVAVLGVALGAVVVLPYLNVVLNSPRGAGATTGLATLSSVPIFGLESPAHYATAFLRLFSNDLVGTGDAFRGWQTYVEAPLTYCGLICLLLLPQVFVAATRRQRILYLVFLAWLIVPTLFPWFRYLFWLFKGDYYRAYSLFSVFGIITLSMIALTRYLERGSLRIWLLGATFVVLVGVLYLPIDALQTLVEPRLRIVVTLYLTGYAILLAAGRLTKRQPAAAYLILVVTVVELSHFGRISVAPPRPTLQKQDLVQGMAGAPADLVEAVRDLNTQDNSFFRITEMHRSTRGTATESNYPLLLGYYGTASYSSFNDSNYITFLDTVGMLKSRFEVDTRWTVGLTGNFLLSLFAAEKYVLTQDVELFQQAAQYESVRTYGNYYLLRNQFSLPLGLSYYRYLPQDQFLQLSQDEKEQALLMAAVLDEVERAKVPSLPATSPNDLQRELTSSSYPAIVEKQRKGALQLTSFTQNRLTGNIRLEQDGLVILQTPFNPGWHAFQDGKPKPSLKADAGLLAFPLDAGEHQVELRYQNPWLVAGIITSLCSLLLLAIARWRWPRLATPRI